MAQAGPAVRREGSAHDDHTGRAGPKDPAAAALRLSDLLRRPNTGRGGESIGRLSDVIVRLRGADQPVVSGLVVAVGRRKVFVPIEQVASLEAPGRSGGQLRLTSARLDRRQFDRRDGAWAVTGVDSRRRRRVRSARGTEPAFREWAQFEPLIGHAGTALLRGPFGRIRRLKPAQIADLLEDASKDEETEILGLVHGDPELEADVFEELEEDLATRLLGARTDGGSRPCWPGCAPTTTRTPSPSCPCPRNCRLPPGWGPSRVPAWLGVGRRSQASDVNVQSLLQQQQQLHGHVVPGGRRAAAATPAAAASRGRAGESRAGQ